MKKHQLFYVTLFLLILTILNGCRQPETRLIVYVGSGMKNPMLEIKHRYEIRHPHIKIDYSFTGSKILEQTIRSLKQGDVLMPGDKKHIDALMQDGFIAAQFPVALHIPMILTLKENTTINTWSDLAKAGVRLCIPNPDMASIGRVTNIILQRSPLEHTIRERITILAIDTNESVKHLLNRQVDAVISWDSMLEVAPDKLRRIEIPAEINEIEQIWIAVSTFSKVKEEATMFAKFVASPEGIGVFQKMGFSPIQ